MYTGKHGYQPTGPLSLRERVGVRVRILTSPGSSPGQALSFSKPFALSLSKGRPFMVRQAHHERNMPRRQSLSFVPRIKSGAGSELQ